MSLYDGINVETAPVPEMTLNNPEKATETKSMSKHMACMFSLNNAHHTPSLYHVTVYMPSLYLQVGGRQGSS